MRLRPTANEVRQYLGYSPETGAFSRLLACRPQTEHYASKTPGSLNRRGYRVISVMGRRFKAHQLAWVIMTGEWPSTDIDHEDTNRDNNRWANLRLAAVQFSGEFARFA